MRRSPRDSRACRTAHTRSEHLPGDVHEEARVLPSVQTDTQVANDSLQGASSCKRSQLCPCEWKRGRAAAAPPLAEQGLNQPGRGQGSLELQSPNTRDVMTRGTREVVGAPAGVSQMRGAPTASPPAPLHSCPPPAPGTLLSHTPSLLFPILFPLFLIQIPSLSSPEYHSFPLALSHAAFFFSFVKWFGWLPLSNLQPLQEEPPGHHSSLGWEATVLHQCPCSALGHQIRASFPFSVAQTPALSRGNHRSSLAISRTRYLHFAFLKQPHTVVSSSSALLLKAKRALPSGTVSCFSPDPPATVEQSCLSVPRQPQHWGPHPDPSWDP